MRRRAALLLLLPALVVLPGADGCELEDETAVANPVVVWAEPTDLGVGAPRDVGGGWAGGPGDVEGFDAAPPESDIAPPPCVPSPEGDACDGVDNDCNGVIDDLDVVPKLVLVLDYSGSMGANFGGGRTRMRALKDAVFDLLRSGLAVDYGLVVFSSDVLRTVPVGPHNLEAIEDAMNSRSDGGGTNTRAALQAAQRLLRATDLPGRTVLLVSDGAPNSGCDPVAVASELRSVDATSIFTLSITTAGGGPVASNRRIAGPREGPGNDPDYYYSASNGNALRQALEAIAAAAGCNGGSYDPWDCRDLCVEEGRRCWTRTSWVECRTDHDEDVCRELGVPVRCDGGEVCEDGFCVPDEVGPEPECVDECFVEGLGCASATAYAACGADFDDDPCREWGPRTECAIGEVCQQGGCAPASPCGELRDVPEDGLVLDTTEGAAADFFLTPAGCTDYMTAGRDVGYRVELRRGERLTALLDSTWDAAIFLIADCEHPEESCRAGADLRGSDATELLEYVAPRDEELILVVDSWAAGAAGPFHLQVTIDEP